jgi:alanine racemase
LNAPRTTVDLKRLRENATRIRASAGVDVIAVVKADAYGHGAVAVVDALQHLVSDYYCFSPQEALDARIGEITGKRTIVACPGDSLDPNLAVEHRIAPSVYTVEMAHRLAPAHPVLCVDTGMQRFACPAEQLDAVLRAAPEIAEAFTHASKPEHALELKRLLGVRALRLHAANSSLLSHPDCALDAVRPGMALYEGVATVCVRLVEARTSRGPVGYTGFTDTTRHGVILLGYSHGLRKGPVSINGRPQRIVEVGMQSSYVSLDPKDRVGDDVTLLGEGVSPHDIAKAWHSTAHEALTRVVSLGEREYRG